MRVIGLAHSKLHLNGADRIHSEVRIGTRTDKMETMEQKVASVQKLLHGDADHPTGETAYY